MNIEKSISTTILANISPKWYYQVKVMAFSVDFVPYRYQKSQNYPVKTNVVFKLEILYWIPKINITHH